MSKYKSVEEFSITTLEIAGFGAALQALRLPFGKECRSKTWSGMWRPDIQFDDGSQYCGFGYNSGVHIDEKDRLLLSTLIKRGDEHAKVLRGVMVWCKINAPRYFYQELDRYRIGCECLSSESTMHMEGQGLDEDALVEMKENLPEGHMQKRIWMFSYQTLRRIYFQRRNHRLPQWRKFCDWIETLPFAKEFITIDKPDVQAEIELQKERAHRLFSIIDALVECIITIDDLKRWNSGDVIFAFNEDGLIRDESVPDKDNA